MGLPDEYTRMLSGAVLGSNGFTSYIFGPDGSKDGWTTSREMDERRALFIQLVNDHGERYVHLRFGDTVEGVKIVGYMV